MLIACISFDQTNSKLWFFDSNYSERFVQQLVCNTNRTWSNSNPSPTNWIVIVPFLSHWRYWFYFLERKNCNGTKSMKIVGEACVRALFCYNQSHTVGHLDPSLKQFRCFLESDTNGNFIQIDTPDRKPWKQHLYEMCMFHALLHCCPLQIKNGIEFSFNKYDNCLFIYFTHIKK